MFLTVDSIEIEYASIESNNRKSDANNSLSVLFGKVCMFSKENTSRNAMVKFAISFLKNIVVETTKSTS